MIQHFRPNNNMDVRGLLTTWSNSDLSNLEYPPLMSEGTYLLNDILNNQIEMLSQDVHVGFFGIRKTS